MTSPPPGAAKESRSDGFLDDDIVNFRPVSNCPSSMTANDSTKSVLLQKLKLKKMQSPPKPANQSQDLASAPSPEIPSVKPEKLGDPCGLHGIECNLWCMEDNMLICWRCYIFADHKGHTLEEDRAR